MKTQALTEFDKVKAEVAEMIAPTLAIRVTDAKSAQDAALAAQQVKLYLKRVDAKRDELVRPLNTRVKEINAYAKNLEAPLLQAERHLKAQLVAYQVEQEEIKKAEARRAEEERRRAEAELRAKQEAERAELATTDDWFGAGDQAASELEAKHAAEKARLEAEAKARIFDIQQKGVKNARKVWRCELLDISLVPKEFQIVSLNEKAILAAARAGVTSIPGVRIWQDTTVAIGVNTWVPEAVLEDAGE